jgi:hypothetical protein
MAHMVVFRSNEGKPGYHQADALDEAVRFVERLRNQEQVTEARIFRLQEVPIEFKTYYRVEVVPGEEGGPANGSADGMGSESSDEAHDGALAGQGAGRPRRFGKG